MNLLGKAKAILVPDLFIAQSQWRWGGTIVPFISENSSSTLVLPRTLDLKLLHEIRFG